MALVVPMEEQQVEQQVGPSHVKIVNMTGVTMDLNVAIQHGMNMELTAQHLKAHTVGIALDVVALAIMVPLVVELMEEEVVGHV